MEEASNSRLKLNYKRHEAFIVKPFKNNNKQILASISRHESIIDNFIFSCLRVSSLSKSRIQTIVIEANLLLQQPSDRYGVIEVDQKTKIFPKLNWDD